MSPARMARLRDGLRLSIFGLALSALWSPLNVLILPDLANATVPNGLRGSAIGLITFLGIGIAAIVQPIAGSASDRSPFEDRRRPFIVYPALAAALLLVGVGLAPSFLLLLVAYVLLQIASNVAQAAFQALIPDVVPEGERSDAAAAKTALGFAGTVIGLAGVGAVTMIGGNVAGCVFLAALLVAVLVLHLRWVPPIPPAPAGERASNIRDLLQPETVIRPFRAVAHMPAAFRAAVIMRFLFLLGLYPLQRFLFYFMDDRFGIEEPAGGLALAMLGGIVIAGLGAALTPTLSGWFGRDRVLRASILMAAAALVAVAFAPTLAVLGAVGLTFAIAVGAFQAVNWELLTDSVPEEEGAAFMGLANVATAGASALVGLLGPLVDALNALAPGAAYQIVFTLAALVALLALPWVGRHASHSEERPREEAPAR